eukprot:TRINITY_DN58129_c0_g1_i1.p1 TRINITY_DN58129_c0_g1~~TRINITY_DN58129_c0_g1_i1.p1  ORF type:complete len:406 (+),score=89.28 TRINITY_DN58129_c0_g1_i1:268-1485(+)
MVGGASGVVGVHVFSTCGGGIQMASRTCSNPPPASGGADCVGDDTKQQDCNTQHCPINGGWSQWSGWGTCSSTCGGGSQTASRTCSNPPPANGGTDCAGDETKQQDCNTQDCPKQQPAPTAAPTAPPTTVPTTPPTAPPPSPTTTQPVLPKCGDINCPQTNSECDEQTGKCACIPPYWGDDCSNTVQDDQQISLISAQPHWTFHSPSSMPTQQLFLIQLSTADPAPLVLVGSGVNPTTNNGQFEVSVSEDGRTFTTVKETTTKAPSAFHHQITPTATKTLYVRVQASASFALGISRVEEEGDLLSELALLPTPSPPPPPQQTPTSSAPPPPIVEPPTTTIEPPILPPIPSNQQGGGAPIALFVVLGLVVLGVAVGIVWFVRRKKAAPSRQRMYADEMAFPDPPTP